MSAQKLLEEIAHLSEATKEAQRQLAELQKSCQHVFGEPILRTELRGKGYFLNADEGVFGPTRQCTRCQLTEVVPYWRQPGCPACGANAFYRDDTYEPSGLKNLGDSYTKLACSACNFSLIVYCYDR